MMIYGVPEEVRRDKINKALSMDYRSMGKQILSEFIRFVDETTETMYEEYIARRR